MAAATFAVTNDQTGDIKEVTLKQWDTLRFQGYRILDAVGYENAEAAIAPAAPEPIPDREPPQDKPVPEPKARAAEAAPAPAESGAALAPARQQSAPAASEPKKP